MKKRRVIIVTLTALAVLTGFYFYSAGRKTDDNAAASLYIPEEPGVAVEAAKAEYGVVIPSVKASGLVRGKNEAIIISETRGVIEEVFAGIGDFIEEDQPVLSVDSNVAELSMLQAEQQLRSVEIDYNSVKRAYDGGSASEAELARVLGQLAGARAVYKDAVNRYQNTVVKAPFEGYLADIESSIEAGNYISEGVRIGKIIDLSGVRVDIFLGDDEVRRISRGAEAVITTGTKTMKGTVEAVALSSDKSTGSFRVIVEAENPFGLEIRSGFSADVSINLSDNPEGVIIPASAVFEIGMDKYVYVIEDNKARLREVVTGAVSGNRMEVREGLETGESVVLSGFKSLGDGSEVIPDFTGSGGEGSE